MRSSPCKLRTIVRGNGQEVEEGSGAVPAHPILQPELYAREDHAHPHGKPPVLGAHRILLEDSPATFPKQQTGGKCLSFGQLVERTCLPDLASRALEWDSALHSCTPRDSVGQENGEALPTFSLRCWSSRRADVPPCVCGCIHKLPPGMIFPGLL